LSETLGLSMRVLVAGATGYVGGRLVPELLDAGHEVRVLTRGPDRVRARSWGAWVETHEADLLEPGSLEGAFEGVDAAYYLVHSMHAGEGFAERDRRAARNFAEAAEGIDHCIYLGGLQPEGETASEHLASRAEVGRILREALPTTEFRAGPVIGSGSGSFEMTRYLTERLPVMVAPKWILNDVQPIAIRDVLAYLSAALSVRPGGIVEIGSPDVLMFRDMMQVYADVRGFNRVILPVPVLTPYLAGLWVGLVTPLSNTLALPLIKGIVEPVVADRSKASELFPEVEPIGYREAVERALHATETGSVETRWSSALGQAPDFELVDAEGFVRETRTVDVDAPPEVVFDVVTGLGGEQGWPAYGLSWRVRGWFDRLIGGPGLSRGRRDPDELRVGDVVDFWRVEEVQQDRRLRLRAEMRLPGRAWLEFTIEPAGDGSQLVQRALFAPRGLAGTLYWYGLYPIHGAIFSRMADEVGRMAEKRAT
jgi:uncharacterized protein YbjT (DUF2867 family)